MQRLLELDLNADLGEGSPGEADILDVVTSANVACGGHAGDEVTMRASVRLALRGGVAIGAHPGFPDRENFGRVERPVTPSQAFEFVSEQIAALQAVAREEGATIAHVKPHGALYNMAVRDFELSLAIARSVKASGIRLLFGLPNSELLRAAAAENLVEVAETFADRAYLRDGTLMPRARPGSVLHGEAAIRQGLSIAVRGEVNAEGAPLKLEAQTLCLHGDGRDAVALARSLRDALVREGVTLRAPRP
ncbi:5-oxoprolinase subunit PxpA [Deinococcus yavapaiensis]|uniref:UPF0271 protein n=1 Tax=Deinococcus yavapaiensis KR-236 TaxID=694435 RepID=A0A318S4M4_9DEIO|nr:5-oxoprolinase subunit PxpA [Deinococcus yavapaiensis]PYE51930.1 UPF0271 protein [Deinococcus yavapaiensis KR-236]